MKKNRLLIEKKERYELAKGMKNIEEMARVIGDDDGLETLFSLIEVFELLEKKGLTLITALNKYDGMPFSLLFNEKNGSTYDLEMLIILCTKSLGIMSKKK